MLLNVLFRGVYLLDAASLREISPGKCVILFLFLLISERVQTIVDVPGVFWFGVVLVIV